MDYTNTMERFSGFADAYARFRPAPPRILADVLTRLAGVERPALVVDLGSGTGLSTRYWSARAEQVIGVEPSADMRAQAETAPHAAVTYRAGYGHQTGLDDACADIVTCAQSLHWMEPQPTFEEIRRILRAGGVFAAFDYDWPPETGSWQADQAFEDCLERARALGASLGKAGSAAPKWDKESHLARMAASGCFRYTRELAVHEITRGTAERLVGLALTQGEVQSLLKAGKNEEDLRLDALRAAARDHLGAAERDWLWTCRIRLGIK